MINETFALLAGIAAGTAGLLPFLHTNAILQFLQNQFDNPISLAIFAAALAGSHAAFEAAPAVFFAVPSANQATSVLPAHSLALQGKGLAALKIILYSLAIGFCLAILLTPLSSLVLPLAAEAIKPVAALALAAATAAFVLSEKNFFKAAKGIGLLVLSGAIGFLALNYKICNEPLFALLSGFFCIPALLLAKQGKTPPENNSANQTIRIDKKHALAGAILGCASVLLPAMTPAVLAAIAFSALERKPIAFLSLASAIAGSKLAFDFAATAFIGKARSGAAAVAMNALGTPTTSETILILTACAAALFTATALLLFAFKKISKTYSRLPKWTNPACVIIVTAMVAVQCGPSGLLVTAAATATGLLATTTGSRRSYCNGCLIIPALLYVTGLSYAAALLL
ncbi:TPA: hypothetical protein HA318_02185 [Candidatus Micrarchaeota archaeon]|nr:hypothetical protein [Candidatus Micrarchaeota archaeon]